MRGVLSPDAAMSRLDELRHVAGLIGIQVRHVDALGVWHEPSEDTLAALIGAFGLPADPKQAADRLAAERAEAPFGVSRVQTVAQEATDAAVSLRLPNGSNSVEWHCRCEDGTEASGRSDGAALRLPPSLPLGYHKLAVQAGGVATEIELIVAPPSCHLPEALQPGRRNWGLTTQLYGLRSARDWGIGDFTDLGWLARAAGRLGAALADFAVFEALHEHFTAQGMPFSWHSWPVAMRCPRSAEVADFARAQAYRVDFFQWLQWEADRQLGVAEKAGQAAGLALGLYRDLAVGVDPHGADAWADQALIAPGAAIGAPPDPLSRAGQNWGLAPINPLQLRRRAFAPLVAALRANMRHAGILRIDHVMGLQRLYCIPTGMPATAGAYVSYPFDDILHLVALESRRQSCAIIGEDLGTVPDGFRERMRAANALSYRVFVFERRGDASFALPTEYPALAAASGAPR